MSTEETDEGGDFGSLETYDPTDDVDLGDYDGGVDESPDVNEDGEIISDGEDDVRDFADADERDVSSDDQEGTTETRKTTLDQQGLDGENIFAGSDGDNTDGEEIETYDPTEEFDNPHSHENADKDTPPTWETVQKSPSRIRWQCETGEHVSVTENDDGTYSVKREGADRVPFDVIGGKTFEDEEEDYDGEGIPDRETAIEVAYAYMESNACMTEDEIYGDEALEDADIGAEAIAENAEFDSTSERDSDEDPKSTGEERRIMQREAAVADTNNTTVPYDPAVDVAEVFGEGVPDEDTQEEILQDVEGENPDMESQAALEDEEHREETGDEQSTEEEDCHDPVEVDFGARSVANDVRDEHEEYLCPLDDRRKKTVAFVRDTPEEVLDEARSTAAETRADKKVDSHGQVELTDREKNQINFSDVSVFHARTVKGVALDHGVKNWLDYYDTSLQADEHIEIMENAEAASRLDSDELDEETIDEKISETQAVVEDEECDHAERGCEDGYEEACEFLEEECDVPQSRIDELLDEGGFKDDVRDLGETDLGAGELPLSVRVALKKAWRGYRAGRADAKDGGSAAEARTYAGIINSIRQAVGQEMIEFEPVGAFEGGVVEPSEVGAEFEPRFKAYDPTEEFA